MKQTPKPKAKPKAKAKPATPARSRTQSLPHGFFAIDGMMFVKGNVPVDRDIMQVWMRRDIEKNIDLKIINLGDGFFSLIRDTSEIIPLETLKQSGYTGITESEFNDAFIEITKWIIGKLPQVSRTKSKTRSQKLSSSQ